MKAALRPILQRQAARVAMHLRGHPQPLTAAATPDGWWDDGVEEEEVANTLQPILGHAVDAAGLAIASALGASYVRNAPVQAQITAQARSTAQALSDASRKSLTTLIDDATDEEEAAAAVEKWGNRASLARSTAVYTVAWATVAGTMAAGAMAQEQTGTTITKTWVTTDTPCDECEPNGGESVGLDESFSSGDDGPPLHPSCMCEVWLNEEPTDSSESDDITASAVGPSHDAPSTPSELVAAATLGADPSSEVRMSRRWRSNPAILVEGVETTEMMPRLIDPGATTWRQLPRDLRVVFEDTGWGHENARTVGRIDMIARNGSFIVAEGVFADGDEDADKVVNLVGQQMMQRVSVDPSGGVCVYEMIDPQGSVVPEEIAVELMWDEEFDGEGYYVRERWTQFELGAATLVSLPAFADTGIELSDGSVQTTPASIAASAAPDVETTQPVSAEPAETATSPADEPEGEAGAPVPAPAFPRLAALLATQRGDSLQASAAMRSARPGAVLRASVAWDGGPPRSFFDRMALPGPTPFTITDDGEVYGHVATWGSCHLGFASGAFSQCITPPHSASDYALFRASGEVRCDDGSRVAVGLLTMDTSHAPAGTPNNRPSVAAVARHYDDTGLTAAYLAAYDDEWGVQVHGALREGLAVADVRRCMAARPSGDWRNGELVGLLQVNVPGFPTVRMEDDTQVMLVASLSPPRAIDGATLNASAPCSCQAPASTTTCACGGDQPATGGAAVASAPPVAAKPPVPASKEVTAFEALTRRAYANVANAERALLDRMMR